MKSRNFRKIILEVIPEMSGVSTKPPLIVYCPLNNVLRGFCFERSGFDASRFYLWAFFMPLCVPSNHIGFTFGQRIGDGGKRWSVEEPNLKDELLSVIRQEGIPFLACTHTTLDAARATQILSRSSGSPYVHQGAAYLLARSGEIGDAVIVLDGLLKILKFDVDWQAAMAARATMLRTLLLTNPVGAQEQLDQWERQTIRDLRLDGVCK